MPDIRILVIDDEEASQRALGLILESDGWYIEMVALPDDALAKLAGGGWNLVIANVSMSSLSGPLFGLLKDLAEAKGTLRVLFLVPAFIESKAAEALERLKLPYATKPLHLHDFLEQVGDLLRETGVISGPLHGLRDGGPVAPRPHLQDARHRKKEGEAAMFADRDDYSYDEEELKKFEEEERRKAGGEPEGGDGSDSESH